MLSKLYFYVEQFHKELYRNQSVSNEKQYFGVQVCAKILMLHLFNHNL